VDRTVVLSGNLALSLPSRCPCVGYRGDTSDADLLKREPACVQGCSGMEPTGIEPVTSCLQSARSTTQLQL
jgi:hypothetical protein